MNEAYVKLTIEDRVGIIEFYHPQSNSLPGHILSELAETIQRAGTNDAVVAILLQSAGERAFCAGASFDELLAIEDEAAGKEFFSGFAKVINAIRTCPKFVVGRVQGKAVGGGVGVASSVDYCFANKFAGVKLSELAVGIGPFVVGPAVERKIGTAAFSELAMDATQWRTAEWAKEKGIYTHLSDDTKAMDAALVDFMEKIKTFNPAAMAEMKRIFWKGTDHWEHLLTERAEVSGRLVLSEFTRNAIHSFKSK